MIWVNLITTSCRDVTVFHDVLDGRGIIPETQFYCRVGFIYIQPKAPRWGMDDHIYMILHVLTLHTSLEIGFADVCSYLCLLRYGEGPFLFFFFGRSKARGKKTKSARWQLVKQYIHNQSIGQNQSINQSINESINQSIIQSFNQSINQSINSINSINESINQSISLCLHFVSVYIYITVHPFIYLV